MPLARIPLKMRISALASNFTEWENISEKAHRFSDSRGLARVIQIPGLISTFMRLATGDSGALSYLRRENWQPLGWANILSSWLLEALSEEDPAFTVPVTLTESDNSSITVYRGVGLAFRRNTTRNKILCTLVAPSDDASNWVSSILAKKGGGVIRLLPTKNSSKRHSRGREYVSDEDEDFGDSWSLEHSPWPNDLSGWVEGSWGPTRKELADSLFPQMGSSREGRSVLLIGPPGVGKTETAIRACLLARGEHSRILVVHGSVFARGHSGMTGRDAVSLIRAFKACALIVDDMPPNATVALLEEFEALYREQVTVAITLMTGEIRPRLPGLRPGRVDEMVEFSAPDAGGRLALLRAAGGEHPMWEEIAKDERCEGMTPAYLRELAGRVVSGVDPNKALSSLAAQRELAT